MKGKKMIIAVIGIIILIAFLVWTDFFREAEILLETKILFLSIALLLLVVGVFFRMLRFRRLLGIYKIKISSKRNIAIHFMSAFLGLITPIRLGEGGKVFFFKENKRTVGFCYVLEKICDLSSLLLFGILGIFSFKIFFNFIPLLFLIVVIAVLFFMNFDRILNLLLKRTNTKMGWFREHLKKMQLREYVILASYTLLVWVNMFFIVYFLALSMNLDVSFITITLVFALSSLIGIFSGMPNGLGTQEVVLTLLLVSTIGIPKALAGVFSVLVRISTVLAYSILGLIGNFLLKEKD